MEFKISAVNIFIRSHIVLKSEFWSGITPLHLRKLVYGLAYSGTDDMLMI